MTHLFSFSFIRSTLRNDPSWSLGPGTPYPWLVRVRITTQAALAISSLLMLNPSRGAAQLPNHQEDLLPAEASLATSSDSLPRPSLNVMYPHTRGTEHKPIEQRRPMGYRDGNVIYRRPISGPVIKGFAPPLQRWRVGHRGVDIQAPVGAPVYAAADGKVVFAGSVGGRPVISIAHRDGVRTTYDTVQPLVQRDTVVRAGERIGALLPSVHRDLNEPNHLGWGARRGDTYIDPLSLLPPTHVHLVSLKDAA